MPTTERLVLDPSDVATSRTALDITPWIKQEGTDWGDSTIQAVTADRDRGSIPVDFSVPNREIQIPLRFVDTLGGTTTVQARANIQAKVALFQKEGGWIKRILNSGGTVYADVLDASTLGFSSSAGFESAQNWDLDPQISLTCLPDFYQDEITLNDHTETTAAELVFTETSIKGDYPARVRIVVDDDQAQDQRGLIWGFRSRHYSALSTAALKYEAESLGALDTAAAAALSGASGGTVVTHGTLSTNWTPVLSTNVGGTQFLTHTGTYRLYARVYSTSGTTVQARAVYDVGDLVNPAENDQWRLPGASNFYTHDFGEVRLDAAPVGVHRWQGQIQAKGDAGGENFSVDKVWLAPVDEGYGVLTAPLSSAQGLATYAARDEFNQTAGTIGAKVLPVGGTWVSAGGTAGDFSVESSGHTAQRTAIGDADVFSGRFAIAGATTHTNTAARVDAKASVNASLARSGVVLRYTDTSNWFVANFAWNTAGPQLLVVINVAGVQTTLTQVVSGIPSPTAGTYFTIQAQINAAGLFAVWLGLQGSINLVATGSSSVLATGGALASGKYGFYDAWVTTASTRNYDNFAAWIPTNIDAVTFASRSTQLTTDGHYRLDSGGTAHGPVSIQTGDLPRLPVAGLEGRTTEVFLKSSRGDFDQLPDNHTTTDYGDDISAKVYYRPSYLNVGTV